MRTKKDQILECWQRGLRSIWSIAREVASKPSYVASVLQDKKLIDGYYDLYTSPKQNVNIYQGMFRGRLGFKNLAAAERSVQLIDAAFVELREMRDRAGQHHCMVTALTMFNCARFLGKEAEAEVFRNWLANQLAAGATGIETGQVA